VHVCKAAVFALGELGPDARAALPALAEILAGTRLPARRVGYGFDFPGELATELLRTPVREAAAKAMKQIDPTEATEQIQP
jgi:HEAT repeat protein